MGQVRVALLGTPDIRHAGESLAFPTRKALALLAYLIVERGEHPREKLAALLWPESGTAHSRAALRYTLTCLRAAIRDETGAMHLLEGKALGFNVGAPDEFDLDLRSFQAAAAPQQPSETRMQLVARLQHAADLWRGEFLEGFSLPDAPAFDEWMSRQSEAWHRRIEVVLDRISSAREEGGMITQARESTERWLELSPMDERAHQRRIHLAVAAGDRAAALRAYETCRDVLQRELGIAPAPETEALAEQARSAILLFPGTAPAHHSPSTPQRYLRHRLWVAVRSTQAWWRSTMLPAPVRHEQQSCRARPALVRRG